MRGTLSSVAISILFCACASADPPDLLGEGVALEMTGESTPAGQVRASLCTAPDAPPDTYCLKVTFRLNEYREHDWIDVSCRPVLDLSKADQWRLWVRAEQPADFLTIKLVDADNPPPNHSVIETSLLRDGKPLPAGEWVPLDMAFHGPGRLRDKVTYFGFYISAADRRIPLDRDLVFYVGRFRLNPVRRPPWPPSPSKRLAAQWRSAWTGPIEPDRGWGLVSGKDNQTDHTGRIVRGGVEFSADADGWNEFLWSNSDKIRLRPKTTYRLRFDYSVLAPLSGPDGATFYCLCRARGTIREDVGWQRWKGATGAVGTRTCTFTTHDLPGYYLIFGVRHHGGIRIDNIRIEENLTPVPAKR